MSFLIIWKVNTHHNEQTSSMHKEISHFFSQNPAVTTYSYILESIFFSSLFFIFSSLGKFFIDKFLTFPFEAHTNIDYNILYLSVFY